MWLDDAMKEAEEFVAGGLSIFAKNIHSLYCNIQESKCACLLQTEYEEVMFSIIL